MKRIRSFAASTLFLSLLVAAPTLAAPVTYDIDPVHSRVEFTIRHIVSKVTGNFGDFKGTITYDPAAPASSVTNVEISATSIDTNNDRRDNHLRSPDFFDVAKFPALTFVSTKVVPGDEGKFKVEGTLTMHGITKPVTLDASFLGAGPGMDGSPHAGFEATAKVDRKDYGIIWNKALDQGGTLLGDDVSINLEIEAVAAKADAAAPAGKAETKPAKPEKKETSKAGK